MTNDDDLRPLERRVRRLAAAGLDRAEIGRRLGRSPEHVGRVLAWADLAGRGAWRRERRRAEEDDGGRLRPLERRLLRWGEAGADADEVAARFRRGRDHLGRVEALARRKLGRA